MDRRAIGGGGDVVADGDGCTGAIIELRRWGSKGRRRNGRVVNNSVPCDSGIPPAAAESLAERGTSRAALAESQWRPAPSVRCRVGDRRRALCNSPNAFLFAVGRREDACGFAPD